MIEPDEFVAFEICIPSPTRSNWTPSGTRTGERCSDPCPCCPVTIGDSSYGASEVRNAEPVVCMIEIVEPFVEIEIPDTPTSEEVAGPRMETVLPFAPVVCDSDIAPEPTSTIWVPVIPVAPAVFPPVRHTTGERARQRGTARRCETVPPFASVVWDSVMLFEPTRTSRVPVTPVAPPVFPRFERPAENPPPAPPEMVIVPDAPLSTGRG